MVKKMGYKLIAGTLLGILTAITLGGTVAIAQESHFSELSGRSGERWTSSSRLPDFSFAGYRAGEKPIPSVKPALNVRNLDLKQANMVEMVDFLSYHTFYGSRFGLVSRQMKV